MRIGTIHALFRVSVKGMSSARLEEATVEWDGAGADRRRAVLRSDDGSVVRAGDPGAVL